MAMNVRDVMTSPVETVPLSATVAELARLMLDRNISGLPVVDGAGRVLGLVTKADLVAKHAQVHLPIYLGILGTVLSFGQRHTDEEIRHALAVTAGDLMSAHPITVRPDQTIDEAASLMVERSANPIPVLEDGRLVGIISHDDIIRVLLVEEQDAASG